MKKIGLSSALLLVTSITNASDLSQKKVASVALGDVISVSLSDVHPTQPSVGYDQVYYKLGRYQNDTKKMFDEICEANGQKGLAHFDEQSDPKKPSSFECKEEVGERIKDMKTIVVAPNGQYYLTDGHHTFNVFWHMPEGGDDFNVSVVVDNDYRNLPSMDKFWQAMVADGNTWLYDSEGTAMSHTQLPATLGLDHFENDQYRSMMYFSRDVGWDKPKSPIPFLEFYWSKEVRKGIDVANFDLMTAEGYRNAITSVSQYLLAMDTDNVGESGKSVKEMGQFDKFGQKGLDKLFRKTGKVTYMLDYKVNQ
ncbi:ParB/Srx family N-terminal domain-containing protein [uncultured Vibrio sp.]|uniref:ParB/Srx family N-terminal domain-containing protein n=1 Tax=uncultured Vibrio sp. TaxID=114054 RepID=UPI00260C7394|nr:ParB/Srx family N-terminal domain-containing protein [uncultured Vibrio sp.]